MNQKRNKYNNLPSILLLSIVLLSHLQTVMAQQGKSSLGGTVTDPSGQPLAFAVVGIPSLDHYTMCDESGSYHLPEVLPGDQILSVKLMGYQPLEQQVSLQAGNHHELNLRLQESMTNLSQVEVLGKSTSTEINTSGFAVKAIDTKNFVNQSLQTNDILDQTAGVRIRQDGGLGSRVRYNINGLSGNAIRIFINGIPMENYGSSFSLNSIPTSMIERIEVYKGVVPAEFGNDALGGAVNVILKTKSPNTLNASISYGSFNTQQASINGNYRNAKNGFTFRGSAFYNFSNNNYKVWGNQIYVTDKFGKITYIKAPRFHDDYRSMGIKAAAGFTNVKWADEFLVDVLSSGMEKDIQHGATMENVYGNRSTSQSTNLASISYRKEDLFKEGLDVNFFSSYSSLKRNVVDTIPYIYNWYGELVDFNEDGKPEEWSSGAEAGSPTLNESREKQAVVRLNAQYELNENFTVGVNQLSNYFSRKPDDPMQVQEVRDLTDTRYLNKNITGVFLNANGIDNKLKTSLFYKYYNQTVSLKDVEYERFSSTPVPYEYSKTSSFGGYGLALGYYIFPKFQLTASAEKAIRMPTGNEVFGNDAEAIDPSYELDPEQSYNANLGFNLEALHWNKHSFQMNFNVFYRNTLDMIRQVVASEQAETYGFENNDRILSKGFDTELSYSYDNKLTWMLGVSVFNARFNQQYDQYGSEYIYYGDRLRNAPYFTANSNIRYTADNWFQERSRSTFYYNIGYVHDYFRNWESLGSAGKNVIPSQMVHSIGGSYTVPSQRFTFSFDVKNITDEQVFDNWALQKPGRAFYAKLTYNLL
ncbi:TonB-dependent receptor [Echinicola pacifica]|nr:TonB-dependent receptor [Echinicola pacifica]